MPAQHSNDANLGEAIRSLAAFVSFRTWVTTRRTIVLYDTVPVHARILHAVLYDTVPVHARILHAV